MNFGEKIKYIRDLRGMSTTDLANASGISQSYISALENSARESPTLKAIEKLANALNIPKDYLLHENNVLPQEIIYDLPEDVREWLLREESMPYLRLAMDFHGKNISPETVVKIIKLYRSIMEGDAESEKAHKMSEN